MLNGRLYRAALVPFLLALAIAGLSLQSRPQGYSSTLAPDAFEGAPAMRDLRSLAGAYPDRRPGSPGDQALAGHIANVLGALGGTAGGGFSVRTERFEGQTAEGERPLTTVIAERPGSTSASAIAIVAHRDALARGSQAELSGTAALLELARVFAARETKRTIVLVSTSAGSSGDAGAARLASSFPAPLDAAIVLGDLAGSRQRRPWVVPYSDAVGSAPMRLQHTVSDAIARETGAQPGAPSTLGQLAHLAFPLAVGEQGVLQAAGTPSVLVQVSGERGPAAREGVSEERLQSMGRGVLRAVDALDTARDVSPATQTSTVLQRKTVPAWAVRLLGATLLLGPLIVALDGLARARRRRRRLGRWTLWALACAIPFLACALFARALGLLGVIAAPAVPVLAQAAPFDAAAASACAALVLVFGLACLLWRRLIVRLGCGRKLDADLAALGMLLVLVAVGVVVWFVNPFATLLVLPALHLWLLLGSARTRPRRAAGFGLVALGLLPLALLVSFYARQLGLGAVEVPWTGMLLVAGGHVALGATVLWSLALGCAAAAAIVAGASPSARAPQIDEPVEITMRGPLSYAGPGSLGGTESALRR